MYRRITLDDYSGGRKSKPSVIDGYGKGVYALVCPISGMIFYVGITCRLKIRLWEHLFADNGNREKWFYIQKLLECGYIPEMYVLESGYDGFGENYWIKYAYYSGNTITNPLSSGQRRRNAPPTFSTG